MDYIYYVVNKNTMAMLFAETNFVEAYNKAQELSEPCMIFQGCFLTETSGTSMPNEQHDFAEPVVEDEKV